MANESDVNCSVLLEDTAGPPPLYGDTTRYVLVILLSIFPILAVGGNGLVVLAVATHRKLRTLTNAFVLSLALADCFVAVTVMPFGIYSQFTNKAWFMGDSACLIAASLDVMFTTTSIFHLSCMAGDRYLAICHPFLYQEKVTMKTVSFMLAFCWVTPIFISFLPILNKWHMFGIEDLYNCIAPAGSNSCVFLVNIPFAVICSLIAFYIPTIVMMIGYFRIYRVASRQAKQIRHLEMAAAQYRKSDDNHHNGSSHHKNKLFKQETKAARTLGIIMAVYCVCWFPFFIFNIFDALIGYRIPYVPWTVALWLGYVNSTINPFLYGFFNRAFKRAFLRIFRLRLCIRGHDYDESGITGASQISD